MLKTTCPVRENSRPSGCDGNHKENTNRIQNVNHNTPSKEAVITPAGGGEAGRTGLQLAYDLRGVLGPTWCPDAQCEEMQEEGSSMQVMLGSETG